MDITSSAKLATALVQAQAEFKAVAMNATNPFYKSKYADLGAVIETAKPVLHKHGLAVSQLCEGENGQVGITTVLVHESGEYMSSKIVIPIEGNNIAQEAGKAISYLRRYALASILGLYADEDTDAEHSVVQEAKKIGAVEKPIEVPLENIPEMSLDMAKSITSSKGKKYGDCTADELSYMYSAIAKREASEENTLKMTAIRTLLKDMKK